MISSSRTAAPNTRGPSSLRLIVRVLQDVVRDERVTGYPDLAEALKTRCARLRVPYSSALVSQAIDQLERGGKRPLIALTRRVLGPVYHATDFPPLTKQEAADVLRALFTP